MAQNIDKVRKILARNRAAPVEPPVAQPEPEAPAVPAPAAVVAEPGLPVQAPAAPVEVPVVRDQQSYDVIGAAIEVHRSLGPGFAREVYLEALALELVVRKVPFRRNIQIPLSYKDAKLGINFTADYVCFGEMLVEIVVRDEVTPKDYSHVVNHLKATGHSRALLLNFGGPLLQHQRLSPPAKRED